MYVAAACPFWILAIAVDVNMYSGRKASQPAGQDVRGAMILERGKERRGGAHGIDLLHRKPRIQHLEPRARVPEREQLGGGFEREVRGVGADYRRPAIQTQAAHGALVPCQAFEHDGGLDPRPGELEMFERFLLQEEGAELGSAEEATGTEDAERFQLCVVHGENGEQRFVADSVDGHER